MKHVIILLSSFIAVGVHAQSVIVEGKIQGLKKGTKVYLYSNTGFDQTSDSVLAGEGSFKIKKQVKEGQVYQLHIDTDKQNEDDRSGNLSIFLQPGKVKVTGNVQSLRSAEVSGNASATDYYRFNKLVNSDPLLTAFEKLNDRRMAAYKAGDSVLYKKLTAEQRTISTKTIAARKDSCVKSWLVQHPQSDINAQVILMHLFRKDSSEVTRKRIAALSANARNSIPGKDLQRKNDIAMRTGIGRPAPDFTQADTAGRPVSLQDFRGKYVLLDFWASWCGPCRRENPFVVAAYNAYKDKGFTVLSVSLDRAGEKDKWLQAVKEDGLTWTHVSDLQYWKNAVARQYDVNAVPTNFLIDPQGKIIAKDLRGDHLINTLKEIF